MAASGFVLLTPRPAVGNIIRKKYPRVTLPMSMALALAFTVVKAPPVGQPVTRRFRKRRPAINWITIAMATQTRISVIYAFAGTEYALRILARPWRIAPMTVTPAATACALQRRGPRPALKIVAGLVVMGFVLAMIAEKTLQPARAIVGQRVATLAVILARTLIIVPRIVYGRYVAMAHASRKTVGPRFVLRIARLIVATAYAMVKRVGLLAPSIAASVATPYVAFAQI